MAKVRRAKVIMNIQERMAETDMVVRLEVAWDKGKKEKAKVSGALIGGSAV